MADSVNEQNRGRAFGAPDDRATVITDAAPSLEQQHRDRVRKYTTLMAFRIPALVLAGVVYALTNNGLIAVAVLAASIPIPWIAVLIANDRPARKKGEVRYYKYRPDHPAESRAEFRSHNHPELDRAAAAPPARGAGPAGRLEPRRFAPQPPPDPAADS